MNELAYLSKKDVMSLFAIRDRTFYSWIEKELLHPMEVNGTKKYDVSKALKQKNIDPADVNVLLAKPVQINLDTPEVLPTSVAPSNNNDENIKQLKNQLEAINAELKDERDSKQQIIKQIQMNEGHQKLLLEFKDNETKLFELSAARENKMVVAFQDKMKEIILSVQDNENSQYQKVIEVLNGSQEKREKGLRGTIKTSIVLFSIITLCLFAGFATISFFQSNRVQDLEQSKKDIESSKAKLAEDFHQKELEMSRNHLLEEQKIKLKGKDETLILVKQNKEALLSLTKEYELKQAEVIRRKETMQAQDKAQMSKKYDELLKSLQSKLDAMSKKSDAYRNDNDELKLKGKILDIQIENILDKLVNDKGKGNKEQNEAMKKSLKDIQDGLNKLNEKTAIEIIEDSTE